MRTYLFQLENLFCCRFHENLAVVIAVLNTLLYPYSVGVKLMGALLITINLPDFDMFDFDTFR